MRYNCAEQFMMRQKALLFGDRETANKIMKQAEPKKQKALGREVSGFDDLVWLQHARPIVFLGNLAKFTQNPGHLKLLMGTGNRLIAEASPMDRLWGIGLAANNPLAQSQTTWEGRNWLGEVLMAVRKTIGSGLGSFALAAAT